MPTASAVSDALPPPPPPLPPSAVSAVSLSGMKEYRAVLTQCTRLDAVVTLAPSHAALASQDVQAAAAGLAATPGQQGAASSAGGSEAQADQQTAAAAAAAVPTAPRSAEARLTFSAKLLQAEFRKGRGPLLHADTILGR